jgi:hypothetical protein
LVTWLHAGNSPRTPGNLEGSMAMVFRDPSAVTRCAGETTHFSSTRSLW